ncbi:MAG: hypothetical protein ACLR7Z_14255 [Bilophila wadsworthia]
MISLKATTRRGQGGDVLFADPPGFIDPDVEVLGGVHAGKGLMYGNGGLPAVPDGPAMSEGPLAMSPAA